MAEAGDKAFEIIDQMNTLTGRVKDANAARAAFVEERARMVAEIIDKIGKLKIENASNGAEINSLQEQLKEKRSQLEELQKEVADHTEGGDTLRKRISELEKENKAKNDELTEIKAKLAESEQVLGMSDTEMVKLKEEALKKERELIETKSALDDAQRLHQDALGLSDTLQKKIALIQTSLTNKYDDLKKEVEALLESLGKDDADQRGLLQSILAALDGEREAISSIREGDEENVANKQLSERGINFIKRFNEIIQTNFNFDESTQNYTIKDGIQNLPLFDNTLLTINDEELGKIKKLDPLFDKKLDALRSRKRNITIKNRDTSGGRRMRSTQKKRPRNKKVTRKNAKRRRTQKKRRPIKKRRTARK